MNRLELVNIVPGFWCNLSCEHCVNDSGPDRQGSQLTDEETSRLVRELNLQKPKHLIFTGGEPGLYLDLIRQVLAQLTYDYTVGLTTNGFYARSVDAAAAVLDTIPNLTSVQLSFDEFHRESLASQKPAHLRDYCQTRGIDFNISVSISDPRSLIFAAEVERKFQVKTIFQKIEASGRGKTRGTAFKYPAFDDSALDGACPNAGTVAFIQGKGFTPCCSNLVFNPNDVPAAWPTIEAMHAAPFYQELVGESLRSRATRNGIDVATLGPEMSSPCSLCERISVISHAQGA